MELGHLSGNPITSLRWRAPKITEAVSPRVVINHRQARALLDAVRGQRSGPPLVAFFGVMYYAALRPGEAVELRKEALSLPERGWGELYLNASAPSAGRAWSESGTRREPRQLMHRGTEEVRVVPSPPALTALLRRHLDEHGTTTEGRLFRGARGGPLSESLYGRLWALARTEAVTVEEAASPLAGRPVRPPSRRSVHLAQRRCPRPTGRLLGRTQRGCPAAGLRHVHRRSGRRGPPSRGGRAPRPRSVRAWSVNTRHEPSGARHTRTTKETPGSGVSAGRGSLSPAVAGPGFEPGKATPTDLQSAPFGRSGNQPGCISVSLSA